MHLQAGALLKNGEYKIEKVLGQGGFGITYLAEQTSLGRKVAIKEFFMKEHCERDSGTSYISVPSSGSRELVDRFRQKFIKEARNIASLEHKHIVPIIDVFEENGTAYYVMKYFSGGSLSFNSAIPEDVALRYTNQLASALRFIHQKRMMHLDIKPSNILLDDEDNVVLIDFGLAKQYDNAGQQTSTTPVGISHGYAPIEQYRSGGVSAFSPATDIYSLGATLYKLLTGTTPPEAMDIVATGVPACPANVSAETWNAVKSAMQPAASSRPQSVDEFLSLLGENGTEGRRPEGLKSKVKTENGKNKEVYEGETELNGNVKGASKREGENLFTHTASESSFDEVKGENGKLVADQSQSIDVVEVPDSADTVISNGGEKSQKNKPGKSLWLILLLLLIAVAGAWFLFGGAGSGDASKTNASPIGNQSEAPEVANEAGTLIPILDSATDKFGFIDQSGTEVVPCKYDFAYSFSEGLARVELNGKWSFIDKSGNEVIPCRYDFAYSFYEGLARVKLNGKYGFIDQSGTEVIPCKYDDVDDFYEGLARVELNGKYGFIDQSGTEVIPCKYDDVDDFSEGFARVELNGKYGYIDQNGTEVIPCKYDDVSWRSFSEGLAAVELNDKWGFIDQSGTEVITCKYDWAGYFSEGLAVVKLNGKRGFIDQSGNEVIPCKYYGLSDFSEGLATVYLNGKWGFIDQSGTEVIPCKYDYVNDFSEGLARVKLNGKFGFIDQSGNEVIPCRYDFAEVFSEGLARVYLNGKRGFIDQSGNEVIPCKYDGADDFSEGLARVGLNDKYFYIDKAGKEYIK